MRRLALLLAGPALATPVVLGTALAAESVPAEPGAPAREVIEEQQDITRAASASQERIEEMDDEALELWSAYRSELRRLEDLEAYNRNLETMLASQQREQAALEREIEEIELVRRDILPLMLEMVEVLEEFVALDTPFLPEERQRRLDAMNELMGQSDVAIDEKYRRLMEAYLVEAEYGQSIEAYEGQIELGDRELMVDFLRIGRAALFFRSLDGTEVGIWDPRNERWVALPERSLEPVDRAMRVARRQAPPDLLKLPVWTPRAAE
jgi:hypothetical protein